MKNIDQATNILEEMVFQMDIIDSFARRGWGLYQTDEVVFDNDNLSGLYILKVIVEEGREKQGLEYGKRYILLPLAEEDDNWEVIYNLVQTLIMHGRGPYFIDLREKKDENNDIYIEPIGVYFIDSVVLVPPYLILNFDLRMSRIRYPELAMKGNSIEIHLSDLWKIRKQVMMALR